MILAIVNSVALLAAAGLMAYSKLLFKRPPITESSERARLAETKAKPKPAATPGNIPFDRFTANLSGSGAPAKMADPSPAAQGKLHNVTLTFVVEVRDLGRKAEIDETRSIIMDRVLSLLGRKQFHDLTTAQGRYILRSQMIDLMNQVLVERDPKSIGQDPLVVNLFFTEFIVQ